MARCSPAMKYITVKRGGLGVEPTMKTKTTKKLDKVYSDKKNRPTVSYMKALKRIQARAVKKKEGGVGLGY